MRAHDDERVAEILAGAGLKPRPDRLGHRAGGKDDGQPHQHEAAVAGVEARLIDGVLSITCPKAAEAKPRRVEVRSA